MVWLRSVDHARLAGATTTFSRIWKNNVASALVYLRSLDIIHRDMTNVLLTDWSATRAKRFDVDVTSHTDRIGS